MLGIGQLDHFLALPFLPVTILVVAHLGPSPAVIAITVGLSNPATISWGASFIAAWGTG